MLPLFLPISDRQGGEVQGKKGGGARNRCGRQKWPTEAAIDIGSTAAGRSKRVNPGKIGGQMPRLNPDPTFPGKATNESFTAEEEAFEATSAEARERADSVLERIFKGDDVSRIDDVLIADIDFENGTIRIEKQIPRPRCFQEDQSLATEKPFRPLPLGTEIDSFAAGQIRAPLQEEGAAAEPVMMRVSKMSRREEDFSWPMGCRKGVDDQALAAEHPPERLERTPFESRLQGNLWRHRGHRGGFRKNLLPLFQLYRKEREIRSALDLELERRRHVLSRGRRRGNYRGFSFGPSNLPRLGALWLWQ